MKPVLYWGGILAAGLLLGLVSVVVGLRVGNPAITLSSGPWTTTLSAGSADADMYTRARVALFGLLALNKEETMYYRTATDSAGEPLSGDCIYVLEGGDLAAHWWAITAYGLDGFLLPNEPGIYSFSKTTVKRDAAGRYTVRASAEPQAGNWIPLRAGEPFDLTARLYNPEPSVYSAPQSAALPTIVRESCQ
ncbi:protein of unknown function DUF1214 [Parvibaculum lavamentivorans DS-1]|uniref:DUF1214 domain-containing protein n=1 Tax=Parvibaculum lavamentivorans (strain DS-1 / DSM 13023 / NCIMB 13966) TaxID=402881 RepID=A7HRD1_PARL1|nr:DUF1214 domain-containing protein [Parvibaculum lavamentivorans]ABS62464.1 protein of unknown function DUF1214 [Parvibaculum lavamentivorans DS-1]